MFITELVQRLLDIKGEVGNICVRIENDLEYEANVGMVGLVVEANGSACVLISGKD